MKTSVVTKNNQQRIIERELHNYQSLSDSWLQAAGMMQHKKKALERHLVKIRREWQD